MPTKPMPIMPSMPGSGTVVPPVDDDVLLPPEVDDVVLVPPELLPPDVEECHPPEVEDDDAPPHELEVDDEVDELDDDELVPGRHALAGVAINRPARMAAAVATCFMDSPLWNWLASVEKLTVSEAQAVPVQGICALQWLIIGIGRPICKNS